MIVINQAGEKQVVCQLGETETDILKQMTTLALENNKSISQAARSLGIGRTTLHMRLKVWGMLEAKDSE